MHNPMMQAWVNLVSTNSDVSLSRMLRVYDVIAAGYGENHRHYHTLDHIQKMLQNQETYFPDAAIEVKLAIWFHDYYYLPGFKGNEDVSGQAMRHLVSDRGPSSKQLFSERTVGNAASIIGSTAMHDATTDAAMIVCDLDLLSLADDPADYDANTNKIRREFAHYSDEAWAYGRRRFIIRFLGREKIFQTESMHTWFESAARSNLEREHTFYTSKEQ